MIHMFELYKPGSVPDERLCALMQQARRSALQIEGVYDLALYQTDRDGLWQCSVDVEDAQTWEHVRARVQRLLEELKALGVEIVHEDQWERRV